MFLLLVYSHQFKLFLKTKSTTGAACVLSFRRNSDLATKTKCVYLNDPPAPILRGVERWNYPVLEGLKRFVEIAESPYHGFNFCCGTAAEGLNEPGKELYDIVRYFGERKKIFNVHFRNIRGWLNNFQEVWPDEGDVDMYQLAKVFRNVEFPPLF